MLKSVPNAALIIPIDPMDSLRHMVTVHDGKHKDDHISAERAFIVCLKSTNGVAVGRGRCPCPSVSVMEFGVGQSGDWPRLLKYARDRLRRVTFADIDPHGLEEAERR